MKILNLANPEKSEIKFEIHRFPDGQQNIRITETVLRYDEPIEIRSRMNSFKDVELIVCANQVLKRIGVIKIFLYVPYFLGARSDRAFNQGECHYLRDVICPIINSQCFNSVMVMDAHSNVLEACLNKSSNDESLYNNFIKWSIEDIWKRPENEACLRHAVYLVSPDIGANKRSTEVFGEFNNYFEGFIQAIKVRKGSSLTIDMQLPMYRTDYVIVDDICDGGATFIEIAKKIKAADPFARIYLIVTHGIFSKHTRELAEYFENIYTTNSIRNQYDITAGKNTVGTYSYFPLVRQFEVF